jgi:hypothetical protein
VKHSVVGEIHVIEFFAGFKQHQALRQLLRRHVRREQVHLIAGQSGQQLVVEGDSGIWGQHCGFLPGRSGRDPQR